MRTTPLLADFIYHGACKPICEKSLTLPQKKGWQAVRICTVCQPCHLWNKGISKPSVSRCLLSYQNHHGSFPRRLSIASPSTFFVRFSLRWK